MPHGASGLTPLSPSGLAQKKPAPTEVSVAGNPLTPHSPTEWKPLWNRTWWGRGIPELSVPPRGQIAELREPGGFGVALAWCVGGCERVGR